MGRLRIGYSVQNAEVTVRDETASPTVPEPASLSGTLMATSETEAVLEKEDEDEDEDADLRRFVDSEEADLDSARFDLSLLLEHFDMMEVLEVAHRVRKRG